jgi:hypothetical protein
MSFAFAGPAEGSGTGFQRIDSRLLRSAFLCDLAAYWLTLATLISGWLERPVSTEEASALTVAVLSDPLVTVRSVSRRIP